VALLALPVMQSTIKEVVDRPRPDPALVDRRAGFTSESFPSGHMMSGFVLYALLAVVGWELLRRPWREVVAGALVALLVADAVANVYMGVHWPSDVLGGVLWGLVIVVPAAWAFAARSPTGRRRSGAEDFAGR
jgi:undecaprenyl-diphosphatase